MKFVTIDGQEVDVSRCLDCPVIAWSRDDACCNHPKRAAIPWIKNALPLEVETGSQPFPDWCPLPERI